MAENGQENINIDAGQSIDHEEKNRGGGSVAVKKTIFYQLE